MIYLLTQDNCPKCDNVKMILDKAFQNKYSDNIQIVHRQTDEKLFMDLVNKHQIRSTPALIANDDVLREPSISNLESFIKKNI